jgi:hypothetical protein
MCKRPPTAVELGMPFFDWYCLRLSNCSDQVANGTPLDVLPKPLGHWHLGTTLQFYLHIPHERAREAAKVAASMLKVKADDMVAVK